MRERRPRNVEYRARKDESRDLRDIRLPFLNENTANTRQDQRERA
jgi:hypothetical protein